MQNQSKDPQILFFAGALSGIAEALTVQPFDMVKTRHQLNPGLNEPVYKTLGNLYKEGGFGRFYRGMLPEIVGMVPKSSGMYATYELVRSHLSKSYGDRVWVSACAGLASGIPEAIIVTPAQVIKVRMQAKEHLGRFKNSIDCLTKTVKAEGIFSLMTGLGPTLWRNCVWNTIYFATMHKIKTTIPKGNTKFQESIITLFSGFFGAVFATCFNAPFDVVKSRFQSQLNVENEIPKYRNTCQSLLLIYKEEGLPSIYKGFKPKAIRMGLGGAVAMATFEIVINL